MALFLPDANKLLVGPDTIITPEEDVNLLKSVVIPIPNANQKPSRDGWRYVECYLEPAPIDTLYIKIGLFMTSLFTFESFIKCFFPTMTSIKNSFCVFLATVKTYTHTKT